MKKKLLALLLALTGAVSLACSSGCVLIADTILTHVQLPLKASEEPQMSCVYNEATNKYDVRVEGIVINDWQKEVLQATVSVTFYDGQGNILATGKTNVGEIAAGKTWRFCVACSMDIEPISFEISELFGYGWEKITNK